MGSVDPEQMARMADERKNLYSLLAAIFREEMTGDILNRILEPEFLTGLADVNIDTGPITEICPDEAFLEALAQEFSRLFMGPGKHVAPYESVHLGNDGGTLWGLQTSAVKKFIEQSGFTYDEDFHGLPDHISVELEFMAHLTEMEAVAWRSTDIEKAENCLGFQKEFLNQHLGLWAGNFAKKVTELAEFPIYPQMATLTSAYVDAECQELKNTA
jgi:putative dimethyl sulfoxide reductase chaperone